jgi:hypothetical protein
MWRFRGRRLALVVGCLLVLAGVGITAHGLLQQAKVQQAVAARGQNDVNAVNSWLAGSASSGHRDRHRHVHQHLRRRGK